MGRAIAIGCLTAILLTLVRGGSIDSIWVPLFFGVSGFLGTILISYAVDRDPLEKIGRTTKQQRHAIWIRNAIALAIALSFVVWAGPVTLGALYAGWLVAIILVIAGTLVVCLISVHWPIAFGILVATAISISIVNQNARWSHAHGNPHFWEEFWDGEYVPFLIAWMILVGVSLMVSVPFQLRRRSANQQCSQVEVNEPTA